MKAAGKFECPSDMLGTTNERPQCQTELPRSWSTPRRRATLYAQRDSVTGVAADLHCALQIIQITSAHAAVSSAFCASQCAWASCDGVLTFQIAKACTFIFV